MMLPLLRDLGWHPVVLCVEPEFVDGPSEPDLLLTIPEDLEIVRCRALPQKLTRRVGVGSLALRSLFALRSAGDKLLRTRRFDLVFFSTTEFGVLPLGRRWKNRFDVPFVVDLQDPWVTTHYRDSKTHPPGGALKHAVTQAIARLEEGPTLKAAAHIISVSPKYIETLTRRYPDLLSADFSVIPFAASSHDFEVAEARAQKHDVFFPKDGKLHWVYAGTAPPGIRLSILGFLSALKRACDEGIMDEDHIRVHFIGTDYAPAGAERLRVSPIASEAGMSHVVEEKPLRIPFLETLRLLREADALLVFGWDDPGYTGSKVYPYILARKPLLSILHEESSANEVISRTRAGVSVTFDRTSTVKDVADAVFDHWFANRSFENVPPTDWEAFEDYTAESMTKRVTDVFDGVVRQTSGGA